MYLSFKFFISLTLIGTIYLATVQLSVAQSKGESYKIYDDKQVAKIFVTMDPNAFTWMMANPHSDSPHVCTVYFKNRLIDTTITNVGLRIRGNTSRDAKKKSFKLSFNEFQKGKDFYGVEKLNINGEHNDPSIIRSKLCWDIFQKAGMISSRSAHTELYINNKYMGLYISVEHIDEEFVKKNFDDNTGNLWKCLYPADLTYKGSDPNVYKFRPEYQAYELSTNEEKNDYSELAHLINVINNTPNAVFKDSLEKVLNVASFLEFEAMNILTGQWDDYWSNMNNYYLYFEPTQKKFHFIPYDYDNTFGVDWFKYNWAKSDPYDFHKINDGSRPLAEKVMATLEYRNLYTHFLDFNTNKIFKLNLWENRLDSLKEMILPSIPPDTYRTMDYNFTINDFVNSYSTSYSNQHVKKGIKQYVNERVADIQNKLIYSNSNPIVYKINYLPKYPGPNDSIYVYASGFSSSEIEQMNIQFHPGLLTVIYFYQMKSSPVANTTKVEEADRWIGVIPPLGTSGVGRFKIEIKDKNGVSVLYPRSEFVELKTSSAPTNNSIVINEFMADNTKTLNDPAQTTKDEYDDWVELYNPTSSEIPLTGKYLTDDKSKPTQWQFTQPNLSLKPNELLLVWCDDQTTQAGYHTNFKLSKSGEYIALIDNDGTTILDEVTFGVQQSDISFGRAPDGNVNWGFMNPTPGIANVLTEVRSESIPTEFEISIYPNPFNPSTTIQYNLPTISDVTIVIYDLLGREVWSQSQIQMQPGTHRIKWNGTININSQLSSGIYLCRITAGKYYTTKKLMLLK